MQKDLLKKLGIKIGHYTDSQNITGLTCFISEKGAHIGIDIRGSNTGSLNTPAFEPKAAGKLVYGVVLTGGSTYGLESAFGIMNYLEENGIGNKTRAGLVPEITGAVIYDIAVGSSKVRPTVKNGYDTANKSSYDDFSQGSIGVGTGATTGKWGLGKPLKGGFGIGVVNLPNDIIVAAFVVTNAIGDTINPKTGKFYSETGNQNLNNYDFQNQNLSEYTGLMKLQKHNTTLAVIATNVALYKTQLMKVAELTHDGMARSIFPIHTNMDGDIVFALSSQSGEFKAVKDIPEISLIDIIGTASADALSIAIKNSILNAKGIEGFPSYSESYR